MARIGAPTVREWPIEEGSPQDYQDRFSAVAREFAGHIRERNWKQTKYQIFFNDKYYYKDPVRIGAQSGMVIP